MADVDTCPVCGGLTEITESGALTCRARGARHFRIDGWTDEPAALQRAQTIPMPDRSEWGQQ